MGFLKGALKVAGTVALGATGIAAAFVELATAVVGNNAPGSSELADVLGSVRTECFERIDDLWTPDEEKDETYEYLQKKRAEKRDRELQKKIGALQSKEGEIREEYERRALKGEDFFND